MPKHLTELKKLDHEGIQLPSILLVKDPKNNNKNNFV